MIILADPNGPRLASNAASYTPAQIPGARDCFDQNGQNFTFDIDLDLGGWINSGIKATATATGGRRKITFHAETPAGSTEELSAVWMAGAGIDYAQDWEITCSGGGRASYHNQGFQDSPTYGIMGPKGIVCALCANLARWNGTPLLKSFVQCDHNVLGSMIFSGSGYSLVLTPYATGGGISNELGPLAGPTSITLSGTGTATITYSDDIDVVVGNAVAVISPPGTKVHWNNLTFTLGGTTFGNAAVWLAVVGYDASYTAYIQPTVNLVNLNGPSPFNLGNLVYGVADGTLIAETTQYGTQVYTRGKTPNININGPWVVRSFKQLAWRLFGGGSFYAASATLTNFAGTSKVGTSTGEVTLTNGGYAGSGFKLQSVNTGTVNIAGPVSVTTGTLDLQTTTTVGGTTTVGSYINSYVQPQQYNYGTISTGTTLTVSGLTTLEKAKPTDAFGTVPNLGRAVGHVGGRIVNTATSGGVVNFNGGLSALGGELYVANGANTTARFNVTGSFEQYEGVFRKLPAVAPVKENLYSMISFPWNNYTLRNQTISSLFTQLPDADVRSTRSFTWGGSSYIGTFAPGAATADPGVANVKKGVTYTAYSSTTLLTGTYDPIAGQFTSPSTAQVLEGTEWVYFGVTQVGTLVVTAPPAVQGGRTLKSSRLKQLL